MITESFGQIIDRMCIEQLKVFMHTDEQKRDQCLRQAEQLRIAADEYLFECATGKRVPYVNYSARFHDHGDHDEGIGMPTTVAQTIVALSMQHYTYWGLQTEINIVKTMLDDSTLTSVGSDLNGEFVDLQRKIDMCNQNRNDLRDHLDKLFVRTMVHDKHYSETAQHV